MIIRENQGISSSVLINEKTFLEKDLGITGDDGCDLLAEIENRLNLSFSGKNGSLQRSFELSAGQHLFGSEGFNPFALLFREKVKPVTVGDLYIALIKASSDQ